MELLRIFRDAVLVHGGEHFLHIELEKLHGREVFVRRFKPSIPPPNESCHTCDREDKVVGIGVFGGLEHESHDTSSESAP